MAEEKKAASRVRQVIGWYEDPDWCEDPWPLIRYCDHCRCILHDDEPDGLCDECAEAGL